MAQERQTETTDWLQAPDEQHGLTRYLQTLRERMWLILLAVVVTTGAAVAYVVTAESVYEAEAGVLVSPVPDAAGVLASLGLIRDSADPLREVETAAGLIKNVEVAERVRERLDTGESAESLLEDVDAEPIAESNIVAVTGRGSTAVSATELANAFATAAIQQRTERLHEQIDARLPPLEAQLASNPANAALADQILQLEVLRSGDDPTLQLETRATPPESPVAPRPLLSVLGGILAGLVLGISAAFALGVLDPRVRREEQLRAAYRLPILARIPRQKRTKKDKPVAPERLTPEGIEAYRTLRSTLAASRIDRGPRAALVTSPSASEGKTTTAVNLAASLALAGREVILIEADLRRPEISTALGVQADRGVVSVLIEESTLEDALVTSPAHGPNLKLLLAEHLGVWIAELFSLPAAQDLVERAKQLADYVVIDSSPLTEVVDALPLARAVDDVVIVVQLGKSRLNKIGELAELLAENGVKPAGFALLGVTAGYHYQRGKIAADASRQLAEPVRQ